MAKEKKVIKDAEIVQEEKSIRCELNIGIETNGNVYYKISGPDQSMILIEGLMKYARIEMDRLWAKATEKAQS